MDGFEWNKVLMGLILALLLGKLSGKAGEILVSPDLKQANPYSHGDEEPVSKGGPAPSTEDVLEPIEPLLASANVAEGQNIAKKCLQCHILDKGGANKQGPHLWDVVNRPIAHVEDFTYSPGAQEMGKIGKKWDYQDLNAFLHKPKDFIKGTKMAFVGVKKTQDRANLIAYLRTLSDNPVPLPVAGAAPAAAPAAAKGSVPAAPLKGAAPVTPAAPAVGASPAPAA